jgi:electron transfer flavoprotein beta subunit
VGREFSRFLKQYFVEGNSLYICVCVKETPDSTSVYIDPITEQVDYERFVQVLNPADACAVEAAVRLREQVGGTIKVLTLGPKDAEGALRAALAIGADSALRLWNSRAEAWGPFAVAAALAGYLRSETPSPDLVLCGDSSSDWSSGVVGPALAQQLDLPQVTSVTQLKVLDGGKILRFAQDDNGEARDDTREVQNDTAVSHRIVFQLTRKLERGYRELTEAELPLLITVTGDLNEPRYPSLPAHLAALKAEIPMLDPQPLMDDIWLDTADEMTLLAIHTPRPRPRHIPAPDSRHSAYQRIGEIVAGGATGSKTQLVEGSPEELAKVLVEFLRNRGFV